MNYSTGKMIFFGILGINIVILIHELGHFIIAKTFGVPVPLFSIGFGPALLSFTLFKTTFQLALLPFGGYVSPDQAFLHALSLWKQLFIIFGGIFFNIISALLILTAIKNKRNNLINSIKEYLGSSFSPESLAGGVQAFVLKVAGSGLIGPIGIIRLIGTSMFVNPWFYLVILSFFSVNLALINAIPIPPFDGGQAALAIIRNFNVPKNHIQRSVELIAIVILVFLLVYVMVKDIRKKSR